ncbi:DUF559 domain-containing protein [Ancylomarina sp. DW003]|nr:DUF559 domain-containing protein [Ancylomarina sp. DW003]MDE5422751.1 DUF559 domain-containing protein [Ancylomarina sp. DW003]
MKYHEIKDIKRKLRSNTTPSEKLLWKHIRNRKLRGRKFLRQHAIIYDSFQDEYFFFVPDFYCIAEKLVIELDGKIHDFTKAKDTDRDAILSDKDIRVVRIKNEELLDLTTVLDKIISSFRLDDDSPVFKRKPLK